jgi:activator of HSP90 ATPase
MSTIHQEVVLPVTPDLVYEVLTNARRFSELTGAPTDMSSEPGGSFSCFGGMILGRNIELIPNQRVVQAWRAKPWESGLYSITRFELQAEGSGTRVVFDHTGFPPDQREHLEGGWKSNYWEPLQKHFQATAESALRHGEHHDQL